MAHVIMVNQILFDLSGEFKRCIHTVELSDLTFQPTIYEFLFS